MERTIRRWMGGSRPLGWAACAAAILSLLAALVTGSAAHSREAEPRAERAWVRPALVAGRPAAGYLTLIGGPTPDRLVGVSSPAARSVEVHGTARTGGIARMTTEPSVPLPASGRVVLAPGGRHLMIFGLAGGADDVPLTLRFASGRTLTVAAQRRAAADDGRAGTMADMPGMAHPR